MFFDLTRNDGGDQESGNHKKYVHPNVAPGEAWYLCVVEDNRQYRDCAQPIDVFTIS
jgi:hypothetical protein